MGVLGVVSTGQGLASPSRASINKEPSTLDSFALLASAVYVAGTCEKHASSATVPPNGTPQAARFRAPWITSFFRIVRLPRGRFNWFPRRLAPSSCWRASRRGAGIGEVHTLQMDFD